jgi:hypothetical protein
MTFGIAQGARLENTSMRSDNDIKRDVDADLPWNPELDSTDIATKITDGAVALYGFARSFQERHQAELSVKRITVVEAVTNDLAIMTPLANAELPSRERCVGPWPRNLPPVGLPTRKTRIATGPAPRT